MRWIIDGADKTTGEGRSITVTADSRDNAVAIAHRQGLMVAAVQPEGVPETDIQERPQLTPLQKTERIPDYAKLSIAGQCANAVGVVLLIACAASAVVAVAQASIGIGVYAVGALLAAGFYFGVSGALEALRDIARNSWRETQQ
ncbi:MAG: hypothetical protein IT450_12435 [Phycisphaerales bacterium]|nr:hypothetical protein [Phycisphaerales bacterium]